MPKKSIRARYDMVEDDVNTFYKNHKREMSDLEGLLMEMRDTENVPIYLTRSRMKKAESVFLKLKRKKGKYANGMKDMKDLFGVRVITLFEEDVFSVFERILRKIYKNTPPDERWKKYSVQAVKVYNFPGREISIRETIDSYNPATKFDPNEEMKKPSGYSSIHLEIICKTASKDIAIEVQLRTMLQNVWGEIEHTLSYKQGDIHPHLKRSFQLLASELGKSDQMLNHLKNIAESEQVRKSLYSDALVPKWYFTYNEDVPLTFSRDLELKKAFNNYSKETYAKLVKNREKATPTEMRQRVIVLQRTFDELKNRISQYDPDNPDIKYWIEMEKAYYEAYLNGETGRKKAVAIYNAMIHAHGEKYFVPYYRLGEIHLMGTEKDGVLNAVKNFDTCEGILEKCGQKSVNSYLVIGALHSAYTLLGKEYLNVAQTLFVEGERILNAKKDDNFFTTFVHYVFNNNGCWLHLLLCAYLTEGSKKKEADQAFKKAKTYFDRLLPADNEMGDEINSNFCDTIAWFYYQSYLRSGDTKQLTEAYNFSKKCHSKLNMAHYPYLSIKLQEMHAEEILLEYGKVISLNAGS